MSLSRASQTLFERLGVDTIAPPSLPTLTGIPLRRGSVSTVPVGALGSPTFGTPRSSGGSSGGSGSGGAVDGGCGVALELVEAASALALAIDPAWSVHPVHLFVSHELRTYVAAPSVKTACAALGAVVASVDQGNALRAAVVLASPSLQPEELLTSLGMLGPKCVCGVCACARACSRVPSPGLCVLGFDPSAGCA